jgi:hypothetical protein
MPIAALWKTETETGGSGRGLSLVYLAYLAKASLD